MSRRAMTDLRAMFARLSLFDDGSLLAELQVESENTEDFGLNSEGVLYFRGRICVKAEHQLPSGLLQPVKIPLWKWERVTMDFVSGLPLTPTKKDSVWVIVDQLTKSAHFILVRTDYSLQKLAKLYVSEIVRLHRVPVSIICDRDPRFMSRYQSSIQMAPYEALYDRRCHTPSSWTQLGERCVLGPKLVSDTDDKARLIQDRLKAAFDRQKSYADLKRREIEYSVGDFIFLKVSPWKKLELPSELDQIHNVFQVSMLRLYCSDPMHIVPLEEIKVRPDLPFEEEPVQILERDVKVLRRKFIPLVKALWRNHSTEEATSEPEDAMCHQYPHLF
ncbi:uncharacterized protein LOC128033771 [Gossypium raimondii]|uniref:uncharacterized protein LOC128033771 n=1 Tax=Gossypium raimondii TaxID=29730 RepID=UPI00227AB87F|nr:uncharacterized protein LOC128033771 [Gossypium raimondii]